MFELCSKSRWENSGRKTLAGSSVVFHWENVYVISKWPSTLYQNDFVTYIREYYNWFFRLKRHIQAGRLPVQGTWLGLVTQSDIGGSTWFAGQTSNNSVINIRWWRSSFPIGPSLALPHPGSWLETHFVLLAKSLNMSSFI